MDPGESVDEAARRYAELLEETGYSAAAWATLGQYHPSNGSSNQVLASEDRPRATCRSEATDRNETMAVRWFGMPEILDLVRANEIHDGLSLTGLCWAITLGVVAGDAP